MARDYITILKQMTASMWAIKKSKTASQTYFPLKPIYQAPHQPYSEKLPNYSTPPKSSKHIIRGNQQYSKMKLWTNSGCIIRSLPAARIDMLAEWPPPTTICSSSVDGIDNTSITNLMMKLKAQDNYKLFTQWEPDLNLLTMKNGFQIS